MKYTKQEINKAKEDIPEAQKKVKELWKLVTENKLDFDIHDAWKQASRELTTLEYIAGQK